MSTVQRALEIISPEQLAALRQAGYEIVLSAHLDLIDQMLAETELQIQQAVRGLLTDVAHKDEPWEEM